jgi:hypothetical protein
MLEFRSRAALGQIAPQWLKDATRRSRHKVFFASEALSYHRTYWPRFIASRARGQYGVVRIHPHVPDRITVFSLYKICMLNGWRIGGPGPDGMGLFWAPSEAPHAPYEGMINGCCVNIDKSRVTEVFEDVFGYSYTVDPQTWSGAYVRKSNVNACHDGTVFNEPSAPVEGFVYQRLIDSRVDDKHTEDLRLTYMRGLIELCVRKIRPIELRFTDPPRSSSIERTCSFISPDERERINTMCRTMGLDYGELDCLRDRSDGRIYVVDVNRTPTGPARSLGKKRGLLAAREMAEAFRQAFPMPA